MLRYRHLDHVVLRCRDIAAMQAFYRDVLHCPAEVERPDIGLYQHRAGASLIDLVDCTAPLGEQGGAAPDGGAPNMDHLCLRVLDWDAAAILAWLTEQGVDHDPPARRRGAEGMGPSIYLRDPEGNTVELKGPPDDADGGTG